MSAGELLFIDSFDHYSSAQFLRKWTIGTVNIVPGRTGNGAQIGSGVQNYKTLQQGEFQQLTMGLAYNTQLFSNSPIIFKNFLNAIQVECAHVGDGRLIFRYNGGVTGANVSVPCLNTNEWFYIEMTSTVTIAGSVLTYASEVRVNENPVLSETQNLTVNPALYTGHAKFASIGTVAPGAGFKAIIDDLYVTDTEYLGDIKIAVLYPNAAGDSAAWTPSPAVANYINAKEHPADDDLTTNAAATTGLVDRYNLDDITGFTGTIKGAQGLWLTKKSDTGTGAIKGQYKSGGSVIKAAEFFPSNLSYLYSIDPRRESPFTSADWTVTEINALQQGIERTQ